jgi:hypothetical protein
MLCMRASKILAFVAGGNTNLALCLMWPGGLIFLLIPGYIWRAVIKYSSNSKLPRHEVDMSPPLPGGR